MALITPQIANINPFSSTSDYTITFYIGNGGSQVVSNELEIQKNSDNTQVYLNKIDSFLFSHTIIANSLSNSQEYKVRIRTYDINSNYSDWSDWVTFWCFAPAIVLITNINNVNNQTFTFLGNYTSDDVLNSYKFILYDQNNILIQTFDKKFDGLLQQEITGLDNGVTYKLELLTTSVNGLQGTSGKLSFTPSYIQPRLNSVLTLENIPNQGAVSVTANVIQIIGQTYPTSGVTLTYESNDIVDLTDGNQVIFDEGFTCDSNFIMKIWCKTLTDNQTFLTLYGDYGRIEFKLYQNKIHAYKYYNNCDICSHFASNELTSIQSTDNLFVWVKQINNLMDIQIEILI